MRGGRWRDHREVIDAVAFTFETGTQWVRLPEMYGNWRGVYNLLRMFPPPPGAALRRLRLPRIGGHRRNLGARLHRADAQADATKISTGQSRWTQRSCGPTSTRPGPQKGPRPPNPAPPAAAPAAE